MYNMNCSVTFNKKTALYTAIFTFNSKRYVWTDKSEANLSNRLTQFYADYVASNETDTTPPCK